MRTTTRLRRLLDEPGIIVAPGAYDGFSARLIEAAGFQAVYMTGAGTAASHLGQPDLGLTTLTEMATHASHLASCVSLPLIADADTGYGNAMTVHFVVRAFEKAGMAALMFEDQVWPKRCGHMRGKSCIPAAEMVQKVKSAVDARRDHDFVIISRTDAAGPLGVNEAIDRLCRYAEAGADCMYADALLSKEDIAKVAKNVPKPLIVNMGLGLRSRSTTPLMTPKELEAAGVKVVSYPRMLSTAALKGMMNAMAVYKEEVMGNNRIVDRPDLCAGFDELNNLMGMKFLDEMEAKYVGG